MREFNIFGPVNPKYHYHVNRVAVKAALREKIDRGRYLTLNAARQTGKTTLFQEMIAELEATGEYFGILLDFELLTDIEKPRFYEQLGVELDRWRTIHAPSVPEPAPMRDHLDFVAWLQATVRQLDKRGVLIIDEFDAISPEIIKPLLSQFRGMYVKRHQPGYAALHSIILVGVRNIPALLEGTQSPFNIADQFTVPYFTPAEVADLLTQHTAETGQVFEPEVIEGIVRETEGQPFLVNRLGQMLTQELVPDQGQSIAYVHLENALAQLINENNVHFYSITSKAIPHRQLLLPMLFYDEARTNMREAATMELLMYGVLRVVEDEYGHKLVRIANPIYRKILLLTFAPVLEQPPPNGLIRHLYLVNDTLNFDGLLDSFKSFMEEHGVRLLRSAKTGRPLEISGQYLLLSYLSAALNGIQGYITIESLSSAGEMDLLAFYRGQRFIVETKIWYGRSRYEQGKKQLVDYLRATDLGRGYMVVFDENLADNPLQAEAGDVFEITVEEKTIRVFLVGISPDDA